MVIREYDESHCVPEAENLKSSRANSLRTRGYEPANQMRRETKIGHKDTIAPSPTTGR